MVVVEIFDGSRAVHYYVVDFGVVDVGYLVVVGDRVFLWE